MPFPFRRIAIVVLCCAAGMTASAGTPDTSGTSATVTDQFWTQNQVTGDLFGLRPELLKNGLTIGLDWVSDGYANMTGGIRRGTTAASTLDLRVSQTVGTSGTLYLDLQDHAGPDPSQNLVGDLQRFSNLNSAPFFHFAEIWYQQALPGDTVRFKIGRMDANDDFSVIDNGANFLNSSAQNSPSIVNFPTYPDTMFGGEVFFTLPNQYYAQLGAYYDSRSDKFLDFTGADLKDGFPAGGAFLIGETGSTWSNIGNWQADGNFRLGGWGDTGTLTRFDGATQHGTCGFYAIANQTLWKPDWSPAETRGLRMFLECAESPGDVSLVNRHVGAGFTWTGLTSSQRNYVIGVGPEYVNLSNNAGLPKPFELAAEAFYLYQFANWASIQPDLQYICHPGGMYPNALVGTLQFTMHF